MSQNKVIIPAQIDENVKFPQIPTTSGPLQFDFCDLKSMNSAGIRTWIRWAKPIYSSHQVTLVNVPMLFLNLSNVIADITTPDAQIDSVCLVYVNDETEEARIVKFDRPAPGGPITVPNAIEFNGETFEFDGLMEKTFARMKANFTFIRKIPATELPTISAKVA